MQKIEPISYHQYVDDYNARWTGNLKKNAVIIVYLHPAIRKFNIDRPLIELI